MQRHGKRYRQIYLLPISNPFTISFPRQLIGFALPPGAQSDRLVLVSSTEPDVDQPFQICEQRMVFFADLPAVSQRWFALYEPVAEAATGTYCSKESGALPGTRRADRGNRYWRARVFRSGCGRFTNDATAPLLAVQRTMVRGVARVAFAFLMALPLPGESQCDGAGFRWSSRCTRVSPY